MSDCWILTVILVFMVIEMAWTLVSFNQVKKEFEHNRKTNLYIAELLGDSLVKQATTNATRQVHEETVEMFRDALQKGRRR